MNLCLIDNQVWWMETGMLQTMKKIAKSILTPLTNSLHIEIANDLQIVKLLDCFFFVFSSLK